MTFVSFCLAQVSGFSILNKVTARHRAVYTRFKPRPIPSVLIAVADENVFSHKFQVDEN